AGPGRASIRRGLILSPSPSGGLQHAACRDFSDVRCGTSPDGRLSDGGLEFLSAPGRSCTTAAPKENAAMKTIAECLRMLAYLIGLAIALVNAMPPVGR